MGASIFKDLMTRRNEKIFQLRMPEELWVSFYKAFPGRGERKLLLERFIEFAVELKGSKDSFIEGVLLEARERYTNLEEEDL